MNIRNGQNTIPLHVALARGAKSCVGLLLYAGANYNLQVYLQYFEIPLHHLCYHDTLHHLCYHTQTKTQCRIYTFVVDQLNDLLVK